MRPTGSGEELERRRLQALSLLHEGRMPVEVARRVGVDRRSVRRWKAAARQGGREAVRARPTPGRPWKLSAQNRQRLETLLLKGAQTAGFPTDLWTCPRVAELIHRRFGVCYHVHHVGRLLRALGWSPQKPRHRAIERDEAAIQRWVKEEWPRIKKRRPSRGDARLQRRSGLPDGAPGASQLGAARKDPGAHATGPLAPQGLGHRRAHDFPASPPGAQLLWPAAGCQLRRRGHPALSPGARAPPAWTDRPRLGPSAGASRRSRGTVARPHNRQWPCL